MLLLVVDLLPQVSLCLLAMDRLTLCRSCDRRMSRRTGARHQDLLYRWCEELRIPIMRRVEVAPSSSWLGIWLLEDLSNGNSPTSRGHSKTVGTPCLRILSLLRTEFQGK